MNLLAHHTAQRIRTLRLDHQLTQREVAKAIDITERHYQRWEAGTSLPRWENVERLADFYKVPPASLVHPDGIQPGSPERLFGELLLLYAALEKRVETLAQRIEGPND